MGHRHSVSKLPAEIRAALNERFRSNWYGDFSAVAAWMKTQGHTMSRSALHRYAQALKRQDIAEGRSEAQLADRASDISQVRYTETLLLVELGRLRRRELQILEQLARIEIKRDVSSDSA